MNFGKRQVAAQLASLRDGVGVEIRQDRHCDRASERSPLLGDESWEVRLEPAIEIRIKRLNSVRSVCGNTVRSGYAQDCRATESLVSSTRFDGRSRADTSSQWKGVNRRSSRLENDSFSRGGKVTSFGEPPPASSCRQRGLGISLCAITALIEDRFQGPDRRIRKQCLDHLPGRMYVDVGGGSTSVSFRRAAMTGRHQVAAMRCSSPSMAGNCTPALAKATSS